MADIFRQRVVWSGFAGGPGLSTFYFAVPGSHSDELHAFLTAVAVFLPSDVHLHIEPGGDVIDPATGSLTGAWAGTPQLDVVGVGEGAYAAPVGFLTRWETTTIAGGSRLRGRTYFVPCVSSAFEGVNGSLTSGALAIMLAAAVAFVGAVTPNLLVWQRPRAARVAFSDGTGRNHKAVTARDGSIGVVNTASIPDLAAVLRTRRD